MTFATHARNKANLTRTENDAVALRSTGSRLLDLFATAGSLRQQNALRISDMFQGALDEDKLLATKLMFYVRNVRGGLGEREAFRAMLVSLAKTNPEIVIKNIQWIPLFGRFDDLYSLVGTKAEDEMWAFLKEAIKEDARNYKAGKSISLAAKWLKSVNTSSKESNKLGRMTAKALGLTEKQYRKMLSNLREYIKVTETKMSAGKFEEIDYSQVSSGAMKNYRNAFKKHDEARFSKFIEKVETGEEKINATTLYPYDILMAGHLRVGGWGGSHFDNDPVLEAQWKALPNYVEGENSALVMADTSGSMEFSGGMAMATAVGLAIYFAERNKGAYKDLFMTFSERPRFVELKGKTLREKIACIESEVANTNLESAFNLILDVAKKNSVPAEDMPKSLIIISDMQFDNAVSGRSDETFFQTMQAKYESAGYAMPTVIFWNVEERTAGTFQVKKDASNVLLVAGHSTSTFKSVLGSIGSTPFDFMLDVLNDEMYDCITI